MAVNGKVVVKSGCWDHKDKSLAILMIVISRSYFWDNTSLVFAVVATRNTKAVILSNDSPFISRRKVTAQKFILDDMI